MAYGDRVQGQGGSSTVALRSLVPVVLVKVWLQLGETLPEVADFHWLVCEQQTRNVAHHHQRLDSSDLLSAFGIKKAFPNPV